MAFQLGHVAFFQFHASSSPVEHTSFPFPSLQVPLAEGWSLKYTI